MQGLIPIEDNYVDVLEKAAAGLGFGKMALAERAGLPLERVRNLLSGHFEPEAAGRAAEALGLHGPSLVALGEGQVRPEPFTLEGLHLYNTPFPTPGYPEMTVNSYLVHHPKSGEAVAFDTGTNVRVMLADLERLGAQLALILLTHAHGDHVQALNELRAATGHPPVWLNARERLPGASPFEAGRGFAVEGLRIGSRLTSGHSPGGTTFVVEGLARPVAVVGDSLFRCSQGGARGDYALALENNRRQVLSLPDETLLCPGHGPLTTVGYEKAHNPFFPEYKTGGANLT
jgi:hydroxyacylglutathione hydrolase